MGNPLFKACKDDPEEVNRILKSNAFTSEMLL
jgi:hypothetical protein